MQENQETIFALGRNIQFDERSRNFSIRELLTIRKPRSYTWRCKQNLDQGRVGACTGFSWSHELIARPAEVQGITNDSAMRVYKLAQKLDEWEGDNYEGSSVLAAIKATKQLHPGKIGEYRWCFTFADFLATLSYFGPIVIGIDWYYNMYFPDENGIIKTGGPVVGGHAILANGVNVKKQLVRLHNSWGANWGVNGEAFISFAELEALLKNSGEACVALKRKK